MQRRVAHGLVLLVILGGCGPVADHQAPPLSTSAYWGIRTDGNAVTAAPWNRFGQGVPWAQEPTSPMAPPGWDPRWGRPIDPGIGNGEIPPAWERVGRPWPPASPPVTPPPYGGWPGRGNGPPWPYPTPLGTPVPAPWPTPYPTPLGTPVPAPGGYSQDLIQEFQQLDRDGDGVLSAYEYVEGKMAQIRYFRAPTPAETAEMRQRLLAEFQQGDVNRDGRMTLDEYANNPVFHILG